MLLAATLQAAEVNLAWDPSISTTFTGYKIHYGNITHSYSKVDLVPNQTTWTVKDLPAGSWFFAATAFDADGNESDFSNEVSQVITGGVLPVTITITAIPAPGPRVTLLLAPYISTTQATIVWQTSEDCSGTGWWSTDKVTWKSAKANNLGTTDHLLAIGSLTPKTHYFYKVTGTCGTQNIESEIRSLNTK